MRPMMIMLSIASLATSTSASAKVFTIVGWYEVEAQGPNFQSTVAGPFATDKDCEKKVESEDQDGAAAVGILFGCDYLKQAMANDT